MPHTDSDAIKPKPRARARKGAAPQEPHAIFLPTLLPDPFGEQSPELCWEWNRDGAKVTLRLDQFGWNASAFSGFAPLHWKDDHLSGLRAQLIEASLPAAMAATLALPWILAYEADGL